MATIRRHRARVTTAAFSPNNAFVATGDERGVLRLSTANGEHVATIGGTGSAIRSLSFAADGRYLPAARSDGTVVVYACSLCGPVADLVILARRRVAR